MINFCYGPQSDWPIQKEAHGAFGSKMDLSRCSENDHIGCTYWDSGTFISADISTQDGAIGLFKKRCIQQ